MTKTKPVLARTPHGELGPLEEAISTIFETVSLDDRSAHPGKPADCQLIFCRRFLTDYGCRAPGVRSSEQCCIFSVPNRRV